MPSGGGGGGGEGMHDVLSASVHFFQTLLNFPRPLVLRETFFYS